VKAYKKHMEGEIHICIKLDEAFLRTCRDRIIEGHRKYGNDWRTKDNLKEIEYEKFDIFNYSILHCCQEEIIHPPSVK
jgi:hypothetical protein